MLWSTTKSKSNYFKLNKSYKRKAEPRNISSGLKFTPGFKDTINQGEIWTNIMHHACLPVQNLNAMTSLWNKVLRAKKVKENAIKFWECKSIYMFICKCNKILTTRILEARDIHLAGEIYDEIYVITQGCCVAINQEETWAMFVGNVSCKLTCVTNCSLDAVTGLEN